MDPNCGTRDSHCNTGLYNETNLPVNEVLVVSVLRIFKTRANHEVIGQGMLLISVY